jgi:menaquinone-dependent protoporphyrinogen IX oxidase
MKKLLITYYSESGSTKEIAELISNAITNCNVELIEVSRIKHLNYDGIVIGTPNMYGKPATSIQDFLKKNEDYLLTNPIHFFFSCMDCYLDNEMEKHQVDIYTDTNFTKEAYRLETMNSWKKSHAVSTYLSNLNIIAPKLNIVSVAFFKGRLRFKSLSFINSIVMRIISLMNKNIKQGDYYKPKDIETWTKQKDFFLNN